MGLNWEKYHGSEVFYRYMDCLVNTYDHVKKHVIGKSWEGRDLVVLQVGQPGRQARQAVWIDGGIHAREWVSPAAVLWITKEFVEKFHNYQYIFDNYDVYIMPIVNPDG